MNNQITIRALISSDAEAFIKLRREALDREPLIFAGSLEDDVVLISVFVFCVFYLELHSLLPSYLVVPANA